MQLLGVRARLLGGEGFGQPALVGFLVPVDLGAEAAEDVEHEADDDEVDADVEEQRGADVQVAEQRDGEVEPDGVEDRGTPQQSAQCGAGGERQTEAKQLTGIDRGGFGEFVAAAGQVAQREGDTGDESCGEAAAGQVVAGEEEVDGEDDEGVEDEPDDCLLYTSDAADE